jgi:murein DD-endopeptidase MepM/ murein hydrolase activator NlpD
VRRGGAGVVRYELNEATVRDGVQVGDRFFPGYEVAGSRVAFYAIPTDAEPSPELRVIAEDSAGNVARARWPVVVNERVLPIANVTLPLSFLDTTVPDLAATVGIDASDPIAAFAQINTELRAANELKIRELLADSAPERLWQGAFTQLANSKVTSRFAEQRTYFVGGQVVSKATHFGYDLASTRAAPITAAARGRVVFSDELGIYGNCVLVDHGLGLATLYGHLSRLDVQPGDPVERGQTLGLSGATGLAGGDHLHFAVLIGDTYVDPIEWWDKKWVRENIEARLPTPAP